MLSNLKYSFLVFQMNLINSTISPRIRLQSTSPSQIIHIILPCAKSNTNKSRTETVCHEFRLSPDLEATLNKEIFYYNLISSKQVIICVGTCSSITSRTQQLLQLTSVVSRDYYNQKFSLLYHCILHLWTKTFQGCHHLHFN